MRLIFSLAVVVSVSISAVAQDGKSEGKKDPNPNFRCERYRERDISVLKAKLVENCDLMKPFSTSLAVFAGEDTILYCCHKK